MANIDQNQYLHNAEIIHSAQAVEDAISSVATALNLYYANESPIVLCVMTGAAVFAGQLLPKLTFSLEFDYVQASRYHGETASKVLGASEVKIAVLTEKQLNKEKPIKADFVGLAVPNRYVFGYGMDINGCWRNLPAIYARNNS
jgi:hypoxanthine phosphoribosyltransferase